MQLTTPIPIVLPDFAVTQSAGLGITIALKSAKWILCVNLGRRTKKHEKPIDNNHVSHRPVD